MELAHALIVAGADVNHANRWGGTPLMIAKSRAVAEALLAAGADPNAVTVPNTTGLTAGWSALIHAAQSDRLPVVDALLAHGADRDLRDENGASALILAAMSGHDAVAQALVEGGAHVGPAEAAALGDVTALGNLLRMGDGLPPDQTGRRSGGRRGAGVRPPSHSSWSSAPARTLGAGAAGRP